MKNSINYLTFAGAALLIFATYNAHCINFAMMRSSNGEALSMRGSEVGDPKIMDVQDKLKVSGEYMKAFSVAYDAFKNDPDIAPEKKQVENYNIEFSESKNRYFILFFAKRLPSELHTKGGESQLGRDVRYAVSKPDYRVIAREFFK